MADLMDDFNEDDLFEPLPELSDNLDEILGLSEENLKGTVNPQMVNVDPAEELSQGDSEKVIAQEISGNDIPDDSDLDDFDTITEENEIIPGDTQPEQPSQQSAQQTGQQPEQKTQESTQQSTQVTEAITPLEQKTNVKTALTEAVAAANNKKDKADATADSSSSEPAPTGYLSSGIDEEVEEEEEGKQASSVADLPTHKDSEYEAQPTLQEKLTNLLKPGGDWNKRIFGGGVVVALLVLAFIVKSFSTETANIAPTKNDKGKGEVAKKYAPAKSERSESSTSGKPYYADYQSPKDGQPKSEQSNGDNLNIHIPVGEEAKTTAPSNQTTTATANNKQSKEKIANESWHVVYEQRSFAEPFRAGEKAEIEAQKKDDLQQSVTDQDENKKEIVIKQPLRVPMKLIEPFRSGIATSINAEVISDVRDNSGKIVIPAESTAVIPFLPYEVQGRVVNDSTSSALITLPNGSKVTVAGMVKSLDGYAGIAGRVKAGNKKNVLTRMGNTVKRIGGRIIGSEVGGTGGFVLEETVNSGVGANNVVLSGSERVVEVNAGTRFYFNIRVKEQ